MEQGPSRSVLSEQGKRASHQGSSWLQPEDVNKSRRYRPSQLGSQTAAGIGSATFATEQWQGTDGETSAAQFLTET